MTNWTKKSDIKPSFKKILSKFRPGKTVAFVAICLVVVLLVGVSIAWFTSQINLTGSQFSTGTIEVMAYGYDADGALITTIYPEGKIPENDTGSNAPLFDDSDMEASSVSTVYIAIKNTGSLDLKYKLSFSISENLTNSKDMVYLGGYWYSLVNITNQISGGDLAAYASANKAVPCNDTNCATTHTCAEHTNSHNLSELYKYSSSGVINAGSSDMHYYRMDYGVRSGATSNDYSNRNFAVNASIYTSQVGTPDDESAGNGVTRQVSSATDLDNAIKNALPGDTLLLMNDITYNGDLVITKCLNFEAGGRTLTVNGNMIYDFVSTLPLTINLQGKGTIKVLDSGAVGGNFTISAPKSQVELIGGNTAGDLFVGRDLTIDATNEAGSGGCIFSDIVIMDGAGKDAKALFVRSNTRLTVSAGVTLERIEASVQATNIEIQNAGQINHIILSSMFMTEQTNAPQIYIHNYNRIFNIILPTWSEPFKVVDGVCSGNTRIVVSSGGVIDTLTGSAAFGVADIEDEGADLYVEQIEDGLDTGLRVYYRDLPEQTGTSLKQILDAYFAEKNITGDAALKEVYAAIETLEIICRGDKMVTATDVTFIRDSLKSIVTLDMSQAVLQNNALANSAFNNASTLENVSLPKSLQTIGRYAFAGTSIRGISIPATVTSIASYALRDIPFIYIQSYEPCSFELDGHKDKSFFFVPESVIDTYKSASTWSSLATKIYPMAQMADDGVTHVRKLGDGTYEIVNYAGTEPSLVVGKDVTLNGTTLDISSVGENAYRNVTHTFALAFHSSVKNISAYAFNATNVSGEVDFASVKTIGNNAFENCALLMRILDGNSIETIGARAFYGCNRLYEVVLPNIVSVADRSFTYNTSLISITFGEKLKSMGSYMFDNSSNLREITIKAPVASEVTFAENPFSRIESAALQTLRFYVPAGNYAEYCEKIGTEIEISKVKYNCTATICEIGEKVGSHVIDVYYQSAPLASIDLGLFRVRDMGNNTVSISSCTVEAEDISDSSFWSDFDPIPETIDGKTVVRIGPSAYRVMPFSNMSAPSDATLNPWNNNNAVIPSTVKEIGDYAFYASDISVTYLAGVETIGNYAFANTSKLYYVDAPALLTVQSYAFSNSSGLRQLKARSLTTAETYSFSNCTSLLRLYVDDLPVGSSSWLSGTTNLAEVWFAVNENAIPTTNLLTYSSHPKTIMISCGEDSSTDRKMYDADSVLPANVSPYTVRDADGNVLCVLEDMAEYWVTEDSGDSRSGTVMILNHFGKNAITETFNVPGVVNVVKDGNTTQMEVVSIGFAAFRGTEFASNAVSFASTIKTVGDRAFNTSSLGGDINLNKITTVGAYSFSATGMTSVVGNNVTALGERAFSSNSLLKSVVMPRLVTVTSHAFRDCSTLQSVYLEDVTTFQTYAFTNSTKLSNLTINRVLTGSVPAWNTTYSNKTYAIQLYVPTQSVPLYEASSKYDYPINALDTVMSTDEGTYYLVDIGNGWELMSFTPIGEPTALNIPQSHEGKNILTVRLDAFALCTSASSVQLPASFSYYQYGMFNGMTALQNVSVASGSSYYKGVNGVLFTADGEELVYYPKNRTDTSYTVPTGTKLIQSFAFEGATMLESVTVAADVDVIGYKAFEGSGLKAISFLGANAPYLVDGDVFDAETADFVIYVPAGSADAYKVASGFIKYADYITES